MRKLIKILENIIAIIVSAAVISMVIWLVWITLQIGLGIVGVLSWL